MEAQGESWERLLFSASSQLTSLREEKKNNFIHKAVLGKDVWQEKNVTTAYEAVVSCAKQTLKPCLVQLNFTSEVVFLKTSFTNSFLSGAKLF